MRSEGSSGTVEFPRQTQFADRITGTAQAHEEDVELFTKRRRSRRLTVGTGEHGGSRLSIGQFAEALKDTA